MTISSYVTLLETLGCIHYRNRLLFKNRMEANKANGTKHGGTYLNLPNRNSNLCFSVLSKQFLWQNVLQQNRRNDYTQRVTQFALSCCKITAGSASTTTTHCLAEKRI